MAFVARRAFARLSIVGFVALVAARAEAVPVGWAVVPGSSGVTLDVTITNDLIGVVTRQVSTHFEGSLESEIQNPLYGQVILELTGGDVRLADTSFAFSVGPVAFTVAFAGMGGALTGGPTASFNQDYVYPSGWGQWELGLNGFVLTLDQGSIDVTGFLSGSFPLAANPAVFTLAWPQNWLDHVYRASESSVPGVTDLGLEIKNLDTTANLVLMVAENFPVDVSIRLTGDLILVSTIPEPGTGLLLGGGLAGLVLRRRRLSCRPSRPLPTCR